MSFCIGGVVLLPSHPLVQFKRGDHICLFYANENILADTLAAYIMAGLQKGERCFCAQKPRMIQKLRDTLQSLGLDVHDAIARGALDIHTEDEVYFPEGRFQPETMITMLENSIDEALAKGFSGFRTAGEMSWALERPSPEGPNYCDQLAGYEKMVQSAFPAKGAIGVCQYPMHRFPPHVLDAVLKAHRFTLEETMASSNHSTLSLRSGDYVADIVADRMNPASAFHYVIQRHGERDVLSWGIEPTIESAVAVSEGVLSDLRTNVHGHQRQSYT